MATRTIEDAHPTLQLAWKHLAEEFPKRHPNDPQPFLTAVYRSNEEQNALYAQGRQPLAEVNRLRKIAGIAPVTEAENKKRVTNARAGQSKHNQRPAKAFDIAFKKPGAKVADWSPVLFQKAWNILKTVPALKWGGDFKAVDRPHFEV